MARCLASVKSAGSPGRTGQPEAHLRTALWLREREPLTRLVSLDLGQIQAARELCLPA
jgi:hypothetical protein